MRNKLKSKVRKVLRQLLLPRKFLYCDAAYDAKTGNAVIAYVFNDMSEQEYQFIKAVSNNEAELRAVKFAQEKHPAYKVATDSMYAVAHSDPDKVYHVPRRSNIANLVVRSAMEMARSRVEHKPS